MEEGQARLRRASNALALVALSCGRLYLWLGGGTLVLLGPAAEPTLRAYTKKKKNTPQA